MDEEVKARAASPFALNTSRIERGVVVPMPTFLALSTTKALPPTVRSEENKLVEEAVVEKKLVVVALVPVAFTKVKFWRVVEPTTNRSPEELMVEVDERTMESELTVKRLEKKLVEVAAVVVLLVILLKICAPVQVGEKD